MFGGKTARIVAIANAHMAEEMHNAAKEVSASNDRLAHTLTENSKKEVAARDRVDTTLAEYLRMQEQIKELSKENRYMKALCSKIWLQYEVPILPDSIRKFTCMGSPSVFDFTQKFLIEFLCAIQRVLCCWICLPAKLLFAKTVAPQLLPVMPTVCTKSRNPRRMRE